MPDLIDGKRYRLVLQHGTNERPLVGEVRIFEQDGETRYEVITDTLTVGFLPEHVVSAEPVK